MPKYLVTMDVTRMFFGVEVEVEADDEEEARDHARSDYPTEVFDWDGSDEIDITGCTCLDVEPTEEIGEDRRMRKINAPSLPGLEANNA